MRRLVVAFVFCLCFKGSEGLVIDGVGGVGRHVSAIQRSLKTLKSTSNQHVATSKTTTQDGATRNRETTNLVSRGSYANSGDILCLQRENARDDESKEERPAQSERNTPNLGNSTKRQTGLHIPYASAIEALKAYHAQHGDLVIPRRYVVPHYDDIYPKEWHGLDLASTVYNMKWWQLYVKEKPHRVSELNQLGFVWERLQPEWNLVLEALITFSEHYGHVLVPSGFVVPNNDPNWSQATWGIQLGNCVLRIRARNDFLHGPNALARRAHLDGLDFVWDIQEHRFRMFYSALRIYAKLNKCGSYSEQSGRTKSICVPTTFVVPSEKPWPKELWQYPLGWRCVAVRQKKLYVKDNKHRQDLLQELGFRWSGNSDLRWLEVVHAAAIYSRRNGGKLDVPHNFVVPQPPNRDVSSCQDDFDEVGEWPWPEYLWGLPLGLRLKDIRLKGNYLKGPQGAERRRQLDALGFEWAPRKGRPRKQQ